MVEECFLFSLWILTNYFEEIQKSPKDTFFLVALSNVTFKCYCPEGVAVNE